MGDTFGTGQMLEKSVGIRKTLQAVKPHYDAAMREGRAVGIACGVKNSGIGNGVVVAVSDRATDQLFVLFNHPVGQALLRTRGVGEQVLAALPHFGLSSICNILAAIKAAKAQGLGPDDALLTVATAGAALYTSEFPKPMAKHFGGAFGATQAMQTLQTHLANASAEHVLPMGEVERNRIFKLGYFTWVEQRGVALEAFEARRDQAFWRGLHGLLPAWDGMIAAFNQRSGTA